MHALEPAILLLSAPRPDGTSLLEALRAEGREVVAAATRADVERVLAAGLTDLVILGDGLPQALAEELFQWVRTAHPHVLAHRVEGAARPASLIAFVNGLAADFMKVRPPKRQAKNCARDLKQALAGAAPMEFRVIAPFNQGSVGIFHSGPRTSPWERHPNDDEFLHVLDGEVDIVVMGERGPVTTTVRPGSVFVVERNVWHRHVVRERLVELYVTPGGTIHSTEEDPRGAA